MKSTRIVQAVKAVIAIVLFSLLATTIPAQVASGQPEPSEYGRLNADRIRAHWKPCESLTREAATKEVEITAKNFHFIDTEIPVAVSDTGVTLQVQVWFEFDSATIRDEDKEYLDIIGSVLAETCDGDVLYINGHASTDGEFEHNMDLSTRRAASVEQYLRSRFDIAAKLRVLGFGEQQPAKKNGEEMLELSRRVEFLRPFN